MTDPIRSGATPARRDLLVLVSLGGAIVIGVGGFLAGRASVDANPQPPNCSSTREASAAALAAAQPSPAPTYVAAPAPDRIKLREASHLVLQNPTCYSVQERAQAQVLLDQLNEAG
ncbi:hypothetical protein ACFYZ4_11420 [Streptomyces sp. NPDC001513]|uniref:hypothetical protein n=1 Tax=Streptomyces sp. NPDC001513 TaxID=3364580 RepID=UPI0036CF374B